MALKTLFLDFDGVLHGGYSPRAAHFERAPALAAALDGFECRVVISSSWRLHQPWSSVLRFLPESLQRRVEGRTGEALVGRHARYREIAAWLGQYGPRDWRALDDSGWDFPPDCEQLIACDPDSGLAAPQIEVLVGWLSARA